MVEAFLQVYPSTRGYCYMEPSALRPTPEALLSEQDGWAVYTSGPETNQNKKDANMLVHLACNRHFPNWWLAPDIQGGAAVDPDIECSGCNEKLPLSAYYIFWGAYRLLNMSKHKKPLAV